jgi:hypothetical protein
MFASTLVVGDKVIVLLKDNREVIGRITMFEDKKGFAGVYPYKEVYVQLQDDAKTIVSAPTWCVRPYKKKT